MIKGDQKIKCISAASIVAKVFRDLYMIKLGNKFPQYNWQKNFGYGTAEHLRSLRKHGITKHHRKKFNCTQLFVLSLQIHQHNKSTSDKEVNMNNGNFPFL